MNEPGQSSRPPRKHSAEPSKPLMRSLGEFFGHVWNGVKSKPEPPREVVRREVQERTVDTPRGKVTLRRTTIDEIEPARGDKEAPDRAQENGPG